MTRSGVSDDFDTAQRCLQWTFGDSVVKSKHAVLSVYHGSNLLSTLNRAMHKLNPEMVMQNLAQSADLIRELCVPDNMPLEALGTMTCDRWKGLAEQMVELELIPADVGVSEALTTEFIK
jgi:hypothetical protein